MRRVYSIEELREIRLRLSFSNDWVFGLEAVDKFLDILEQMEEKDETTLRAPMPRSDKTLEE